VENKFSYYTITTADNKVACCYAGRNKFSSFCSLSAVVSASENMVYKEMIKWNDTKDKPKKAIQSFCMATVGAVVLLSCNWFGNKNEKLIFNPPLNKSYHFSLTKYSVQSWTYQSVPWNVFDTGYLNFSLENIGRTDTSDTCKFTLESFIWKGKFKVNYQRDSLHALSARIVLTDSGKVESVQNMNAILQDIESDSATPKYLNGVIPDQVSETAITDLFNRIFSVIPAKKVKLQDTWITNITLNTKHPINSSNYNLLVSRNGDTASVEIQSNIFARLSAGYEFYIKGNQKGDVLIDYRTGIPFSYKTESEIVTTTSYYDITNTENFILTRKEK
jgi:hypothetical protein